MPDCSLPRTERLRSLGAVRRMFESGESGFIFPFRYVWFAEADEIPSVEVLFSVPKLAVTNENGVATFKDVEAKEHSLEIHRSDGVVERRQIALQAPSAIDPATLSRPIPVKLPLVQVHVEGETMHGAAMSSPSWGMFAAFAAALVALNAAAAWAWSRYRHTGSVSR